MTTMVEELSQLETLAEGRTFALNGRTWQAEGGGVFTSGPFRLRADEFQGDINQGRVMLDEQLQIGRWYASGGLWYYIIGPVDGEEAFWVSSWSRGSFDCFQTVTTYPEGYRPTGGRPDDIGEAVANLVHGAHFRLYTQSLRTDLELIEERQRYAAIMNEATNQREQAMREEAVRLDEFHRALREWAEGELVTTDLESLSALMVEHGFPPLVEEREDVEVTCSVQGTTTVYLDDTDVREWIDDGLEVNGAFEGRVEVPWLKQVTVTKSVEAGDCACDEVETDDIIAALDEEGISDYVRSSVTFDASCPYG